MARVSKGDWIRPLLWVGIAAIAAIPLSALVDKLGANIPAFDLLSGHIQAILAGCLLTLTLPFWPGEPWEKRALLIAWSLKLVVVLVAMLFYESLYATLDAYSFYAGYTLSPDSLPVDPKYGFNLGGGTNNITTIVQVLKQGFGASYHTIKLLFAYAGFGACYIAYKAGTVFVGRRSLVWLLLLLLTPSMLFWTGILGKDPFVVLGVSVFLYGAALYFRDRSSKGLWMIALGAFLAVTIRFWLLIAMLLPLMYLFTRLSPRHRRWPIALGMGVALLGGVVALAALRGVTSPSDVIPALAQVSQQWAEGGSAQKLEVPFDSLGGLVAFIPLGAFTALFRPLPLEVPNAFGMLAGLENAILLGFGLYLILRKGFRPLRDPRIIFLLLFLAAWALVYSLISFQNLGTASRFRVQALPILLLLYWLVSKGKRANERVSE